jgi:hypothetical protein
MTARLRYTDPYHYKWLPTSLEFEHNPLESIVVYELLYVLALVLVSLCSFTLGLLIGGIWILAL